MAEARRLLKYRLARRGVSLLAVLCGLAVSGGAVHAAVPAALAATVSLGAASALSGRAAALARSVLRGMLFAELVKPALELLAVLGVMATGAGAAALGTAAAETTLAYPEAVPPVAEPAAKPERPRVDRFGDPLPEGASSRLGTVRLRHDFIIHSVRFAPDGKSVLAIAGASTARPASRWGVATGRELPAPKLSNRSVGVA